MACRCRVRVILYNTAVINALLRAQTGVTYNHPAGHLYMPVAIRKCNYLAYIYAFRSRRVKSLHFVLLPLLHPTNKDHYRPFSDVYGQLPSNLDQPSLKVTKEIHNEIDHQRKSLLVAGKVRSVITCGECCKPQNNIHFFFFLPPPPHTQRLVGNP